MCVVRIDITALLIIHTVHKVVGTEVREARGDEAGGGERRAGLHFRPDLLAERHEPALRFLPLPGRDRLSAHRIERLKRRGRDAVEPEREDAARLPCLATCVPQPATISAATVETL